LVWTVTNVGTIAANATWYDRVYLSSTPTFNPSTAVATDYFWTGFEADRPPLTAAGGAPDHYTIQHLIPIPHSRVTGLKYPFVKTDSFNDQGEADETNNVSAPIPITLSAPDLAVPAAPTAPATGILSGTISVSWVVQNVGSVTAPAFWYDGV